MISVSAEIARADMAPGDVGVLRPVAWPCPGMSRTWSSPGSMSAARSRPGMSGARPRSSMSGARSRPRMRGGCMGCGLGRTFWWRTVGFRPRRQRKYGHKRYQRKHYPSASGRLHFHLTSTAGPMFPEACQIDRCHKSSRADTCHRSLLHVALSRPRQSDQHSRPLSCYRSVTAGPGTGSADQLEGNFGMRLMPRQTGRQMPRESRRLGKLPTHDHGEKGRSNIPHARRRIPVPVLLSHRYS